MTGSSQTCGVRVVRGPSVTIARHPDTVDTAEELVDWAATRSTSRPLAVDLFCGAGGLSIGLTDAGYDVVLGVDNDPVALQTYSGLHPGLTLCRDLSDPTSVYEVAELIAKLKPEVVAGGTPCQPFSKAGTSKIRSLVQAGLRSAQDERSDLWQAFLQIVRRVRPPAVMLENVPDMAIAADTSIVRKLIAELEEDSYAVHTTLLHARDHGVPQLRQRFFLVALAGRTHFDWPQPISQAVSVRDAIGDLPPVEGGWRPAEGADGFLCYRGPTKPTAFVRRVRTGMRGVNARRVHDHITRPVRDDDRIIFDSMDSSTRYSDLDESLKRYRDDIFDDKYKRLDWDGPSRSITAHIARDGYWYIHPDQPRTLTIREAARLQTFPDRVRFAGPPSAALRQIGNAVPPMLAERVARSIRQALASKAPAKRSTHDLAERITLWFEGREPLTLPWLDAPTTWSALQGQLLLNRASCDVIEAAWPSIKDLDTPLRSIKQAGRLRDVASEVGRAQRVDQILTAAYWYTANPDALGSCEGLRRAPHIGARTAEVASLVGMAAGPTPVVVNQGSLRVASRVFGLNLNGRRSQSQGRLAVTRLLGASSNADVAFDESRLTMAGVLELAASTCTPRNPKCHICPLQGLCATG